MVAQSPYATALELGAAGLPWVKSTEDGDRVRAYATYEDIYNNPKEAYKKILRVDDGEEIGRRYIPAARSIVEGTNRYLAKGLTFVTDPRPDVPASPEQQALDLQFLQDTFTREEFMAKFLSMKRWMLTKGDGVFHVSADASKPEGTRVRITEIAPEFYFHIEDPVDSERVVGCYLVSVIKVGDDEIAQRLEYRRILTPEDSQAFGIPIGQIYTKLGYYEVDGWDDRAQAGFTEDDLAPVDPPAFITASESGQALLAGLALPADITSLPVYHFRNRRKGTEPFGISELQGIETVLAGITQAATDQDMAIALAGIGVYVTDSGSPKNARGEDEDWVIAPASVLEIQPGSKFARVEGATNVDSLSKHWGMLEKAAQEASGTPDVAIGTVDVTIAESGIALAIRMAPVLSKNEETEVELQSKLNQMLFDLLNGWFPAYEGRPATGTVVKALFSDPLPKDADAIVSRMAALVTAKIVSIQWAQDELKRELGYDFPADMLAQIASEQQQLLDPTGARLDAAATGGGTDQGGGVIQ